jgi:hypothetical protein
MENIVKTERTPEGLSTDDVVKKELHDVRSLNFFERPFWLMRRRCREA